MRITTSFKRAWLRRQARAAANASPPVSLLTQLNAQLDTRIDAVADGQAIISTSADGQTTQLAAPGGSTPGPVEMAGLAEEMIRRHENAVAALGGNPSDATILAKMLASLWPARESTNSFISLRHASAG